MKICIDPGHGMSAARMGVYDPGAVARSGGQVFEEADIALEWSIEIAAALADRGQIVWCTRRDRVDTAPTGMRATRATHNGCRALISVHCNAFHLPSANGTETLYRSPASEPVAKAVNAAMVGALGTVDRGVKYRPELAVLKFPGVAILLELGFITNDGDRIRLLDPAIRAAGVEAIVDSFLKAVP